MIVVSIGCVVPISVLIFVASPLGFSSGSSMLDLGSQVFELVIGLIRALCLEFTAPSIVVHRDLSVLSVHGVLTVSLQGCSIVDYSRSLVFQINFCL